MQTAPGWAPAAWTVLDHWGLRRTGVGVIRRIDVHATPSATWDRLHAEAASYAGDYELARRIGSTPQGAEGDIVTLHAAINDAPRADPGEEADRLGRRAAAELRGRDGRSSPDHLPGARPAPGDR